MMNRRASHGISRSGSLRVFCRALRTVGVAWIVVLLTQPVSAGDLADIKARGKITMLCFAKQDSLFVQARLDLMREQDLKLTDLRDPEQFRGSDVDLMKAFAKHLGVALEVRSVTKGYDALIPALINREGDAIASSISITEKRLEQVDFSDPYLSSWVVVAVPFDSSIASLADLSGKKAVLMRGSSQLEFLKAAAPDAEIVVTDFTMQSYVAVTEREADFTLLDSDAEVGQPASSVYPELKVAFRFRPFDYGIAIRKNSDLRGPLNEFIAGAKQSGEITRILQLYRQGAGQASATPSH